MEAEDADQSSVLLERERAANIQTAMIELNDDRTPRDTDKVFELYSKDVVYKDNIATVNINSRINEIESQLFDNNRIEDLISKEISFYYSISVYRGNIVLINNAALRRREIYIIYSKYNINNRRRMNAG